MKYLIDRDLPLPDPAAATDHIENPDDREAAGRQLLKFFLYDGKIRGVGVNAEVFEHDTCPELSKQFLAGLKSIRIRACGI